MAFLVTGGAGFIGSYLARKLVGQGQEVVLFDFSPNIDVISDIVDKVKVIRGDVSDITEILDTVKKHNAEYIVHLAYLLTFASNEKPLKATKINCEGTNNIFEVARIADVKRVVYASSVSVYGPARFYDWQPVNEDAPTRPTTVYGACKVLNEFMGQHYYNTYQLDNIGLRFTVVYGPGRIRGISAFASEFIEKPALGEPVKVPYGDQKIDWQYVKDAVRAITLAFDVEQPKHRIFNTGGPVHTFREAANYVKKFLPEAVIEVGSGDGGWQMLFDITRAREELGYEPLYTLEEGIREHINIIRARRGLPAV